jgi:hypothetical protein
MIFIRPYMLIEGKCYRLAYWHHSSYYVGYSSIRRNRKAVTAPTSPIKSPTVRPIWLKLGKDIEGVFFYQRAYWPYVAHLEKIPVNVENHLFGVYRSISKRQFHP